MNFNKHLNITAISLLLLFGTLSARACTVPVFQYAMERWNQSYYEGVLLYDGSLSEKEQKAFSTFQKMLNSDNSMLNLRVIKLNVGSRPDEYKNLLQGSRPDKLPALALWYPLQKGSSPPFWTGSVNIMPLIANVLESEKRREVTDHLTKGSPIVWILVHPFSRAGKDDLMTRLKKEISNSVAAMKRNPQFQNLIKMEDGSEASFPVVTVASEDPEEAVFISMLTGLRDNRALKKAFVVPVFGRGRALTHFAADQISQERIYSIMSFLMSPCACQVKMANPGTDMMVKADWKKAFDEYAASSSAPPLTGVMPDSTTDSFIAAENDSIIDLTTDQNASFLGSRILSTTGKLIGILILVIGTVTFIVLKRK